MEFNGKNIIIFSNSQASLIAGLKPFKTAPKKDLNCRSLLIKLADRDVVKLIWGPGHRPRREENELDDELARKGVQTLLL